ncbi:preprotein translocase subunit YajC [Terrihabitans sp. B22-R8]|uniref:preprotein translocase subunit YajC n=1 Tax=Terrihabitans sp. B22-R8 TaxID=3425128 RepID=UPI00403D4D7F
MFITPAFAQGAAAGGGENIFVSLVPFLLIFVIMYFLVIRPQQKRLKTHRELTSNLRRGDTIVTSGGLIGKITKTIDEAEVEVQIAENVRVRVSRGAVTEVRAKGEPVGAEA